MSESEFQTLRADILRIFTQMQMFQEQLQSVQDQVQSVQAEVHSVREQVRGVQTHVEKLEIKLDDKPSTGAIYQAALTTFAGMFATMLGTIVALNSLGMFGR